MSYRNLSIYGVLIEGHEFEEILGVCNGRAAVHGVAKSRTRLNDLTELTESALECNI